MEKKVEEAANNANNKSELFPKFPAGYRFCPYDQELILDYLKPKITNQHLHHHLIYQLDVYQHNPHYLAENFKAKGDKTWYFYTIRFKKYKNGRRPRRKAGDGYWKATGADKAIKVDNDKVIGYRKALVFYEGSPPKGVKSQWIMHEFRVDGPSQPPSNIDQYTTIDDVHNMKLDFVLCRIYKKDDGASGNERKSRGVKRKEMAEEEKSSTVEEGADDPPGYDVFSDTNDCSAIDTTPQYPQTDLQEGVKFESLSGREEARGITLPYTYYDNPHEAFQKRMHYPGMFRGVICAANTYFDTSISQMAYDVPMNHFYDTNTINMHSNFIYGDQQQYFQSQNNMFLTELEPTMYGYGQPLLNYETQYVDDNELMSNAQPLEISTTEEALLPFQSMPPPEQTVQETESVEGL